MSEAHHSLSVGDFERALDSYATVAGRYPENRSVRKEFARAVEEIKVRADGLFQEKDFAAAEKTYSLLLSNFPRFSSFAKSLSFGRGELSRLIGECQKNLSERRARQALAEGDYLRVLEGFKSLPPETLRQPSQSAGLRRIMEETRDLAGKAVARKDFVAAGKGYAVLWREYPLAQQAGIPLSFSRNEMEDGLKKCRVQLTRDGLDLYRQGKLKEAIAIWQGLLEFDPDNIEIRKAVDTATEQLKTIKKE